MIFRFRRCAIVILDLITFSCNGSGQAKLHDERSNTSNQAPSEQTITRQKSDPIKYAAGDVVTRIFLDRSGTVWFTTLNGHRTYYLSVGEKSQI